MVNVRSIKSAKFVALGFRTKKEAIEFIKANNIKSNKNEDENSFLNILIMKRKENRIKKINETVAKVNDSINSSQDITIHDKMSSETAKNIIKAVNRTDKRLLFTIQYDNDEYRSYVGDKSNFYEQEIDITYGSDTQANIINHNVKSINVKIISNNGNHKSIGAFFKYYNKSVIDLSRYAIFKNSIEANYTDNCLIQTLIQSGIFSVDEINNMRLHCKRRETSLKSLNSLSDEYNITFNIYRYRNDSEKIEKKVINSKQQSPKIVNIALYDNHWFLYEDVNTTRFFVTNYNEISNFVGSDLVNYQTVNKYCKNTNKYITRKDRKDSLNSLSLINLLYKYNLFETINLEEAYQIPFYDYFKDDAIVLTKDNINGSRPKECKKDDHEVRDDREARDNLSEPPKEQEYYKNSSDNHVMKKIEYITYADFETTTMKNEKTNSDKHNAFMISYITTDLNDNIIDINTFHGQTIAELFLCCLKDKSIVYFHNLKYDKNFLFDYLNILKYTEKDGQLYEISALYKTKKLYFRDSYKLISTPLQAFSSMFDLNVKKEVFPYNFYNEANITNILNGNMMSIYMAKKCIPSIKHDLFDECIKNVNHTKTKFNALEYAKYYCEQDVRVLYEGLKKFRHLVLEALNIDIIYKLTISSVAEQYLVNEGCYDGVYELSGVVQSFINKSVYGGRVMIARNTPIEKNIPIQDFDKVSLYPYAMSIIDGFPIGVPSLIESNFDINCNNLYYIEIELLDSYYQRGVGNKINIETVDNVYQETNRYEFDYDFPLFADKIDGVIEYTNFPKNRNHVVNNYILQDLIKFYRLEKDVHYKIIQGIIFNDGFNNNINNVMKFLFNERVKQKKAGNKLEQIYKLIMNSAYGKTLTKYNDTSTIIFNTIEQTKINNYLYKNYNNIKEVLYTQRHTIIKLYNEYAKHWNCVHVGSAILAKSKNIMNDVFFECHIKGLTPFYQDTDSIHIPEAQIALLPHDFIGNKFHQFHCDFDEKPFKDDINKNIKYIGSPVYSIKSIFLAKKCYIDVLRHRQCSSIKYHIRHKGINEEIIIKTAEERGQNPYELYKSLLEKEKIDFNDKYSTKPKFKQISICDITNREDMIKTIQF